MSTIAKEKFEGKFDINFTQKTKPQNLKCICLEHNSEYVSITAYPSMTFIKRSLFFDKQKKTFFSDKPKKINDRIQPQYFSLFLGIYNRNQKQYLIFANKVKLVPFVKKNVEIFRIEEIKVFSLSSYALNPAKSHQFNSIFNKGFFFSYDFDLTKPFSLQNVVDFRKKQKPNWIFFTNRTLTKIFTEKLKEWTIPVIFGNIGHTNINKKNLDSNSLSLIMKFSIFDILFDKKDFVLNNLWMRTRIIQYDMCLNIQQEIFLLSFIISKNYYKELTFQDIDQEFQKNHLNIKQNLITQQAEDQFYKNFEISSQKEIFYYNNYKKNFKNFQEHIQPLISKDIKIINTLMIEYSSKEKFQNFLPIFISQFYIFCQNEDLDLEQYTKFEKQILKISIAISKHLKRLQVNFEKLKSVYLPSNNSPISFFKKIWQTFRKDEKQEYQRLKTSIKAPYLMQVIFRGFEQDLQTLMNENIDEIDIFNKQQIKITSVTFNCSGFPPQELNINSVNFVRLKDVQNTDIFILSLQEVVEMKSKNLGNIILESKNEVKEEWIDYLEAQFQNRLKLIYKKNIVGLFILIFVRPNILQDYRVKITNDEMIRLGAFNLANKGALQVILSINFQFLQLYDCHLASGTKSINMDKRIENLKEILKNASKNPQSILTLIMGDMNFRNKNTYEEVLELIDLKKNTVEERRKQIQGFVSKDEFQIIQEQEQLDNLQEEQIYFLPTYKYNPGENEFDIQQGKRIPSYTDRILYINDKDLLTGKKYNRCEGIYMSDHRPVIFTTWLDIKNFKTEQFVKLFLAKMQSK